MSALAQAFKDIEGMWGVIWKKGAVSVGSHELLVLSFVGYFRLEAMES